MASVLVVEDDHAISKLMCEALVDLGFSVEAVENDMAAYGRITALPTIDALVLDVNLGAGTTGYDIARFARQVIPTVAVVYVSGDVKPTSFKAVGVPDSEFVEKPFMPAVLAEAVLRKLCSMCTCH